MATAASVKNRLLSAARQRWSGLLLPVLLAVPFAAQAQNQDVSELQLFEPVDSGQESAPARSTQGNNGSAEPAFVLVGSARFGDRYSITLRDRSGETLRLRMAEGETVSVPDQPAYQVTALDARTVLVRLPGDQPCQASDGLGVQCAAPDQARLQLATAEAIPVPRDTRQRRAERDDARRQARRDADQASDENPFAAAIRAARDMSDEERAAMRERADRFEARRIDPDDLPEGARVVRTPFGDRIIRD